MIRNYSDHAANERTFLSWVRTGIAVIAFGFVIEKFTLFVLTLASPSVLGQHGLRLRRLSGPVGRYEGVAFIAAGIALIILATVRFMRTSALLDDASTYSAGSVRSELIVSVICLLLVASYSIYIALE
jgi:putative membrane protein